MIGLLPKGGFMKAVLTAAACLVLFIGVGKAQPAPEKSAWGGFRFLLGEWVGLGQGKPGEGTGYFSFAFDLQERILVRRNHTEYPAAQGRPGFSHDDLMVIYRDDATKSVRAVYFDNEDHVIHYTAGFSADNKTLILLSDLLPSQPRFRLTYSQVKEGDLVIKFEIAPPGKPDVFATYLEGRARKK